MRAGLLLLCGLLGCSVVSRHRAGPEGVVAFHDWGWKLQVAPLEGRGEVVLLEVVRMAPGHPEVTDPREIAGAELQLDGEPPLPFRWQGERLVLEVSARRLRSARAAAVLIRSRAAGATLRLALGSDGG